MILGLIWIKILNSIVIAFYNDTSEIIVVCKTLLEYFILN